MGEGREFDFSEPQNTIRVVFLFCFLLGNDMILFKRIILAAAENGLEEDKSET